MRSVTTTHPRLLRHTLPLLLVVAAMPFPTSLLGRYASVPIALALYGVNVLGCCCCGCATTSSPSGWPPHRWIRTWRRFGWELRGNLVVFLLCIPAGYVLGGKGPYVLALLFFSNRAAPARRRWQRRGSE
jgi:hypothetical protein